MKTLNALLCLLVIGPLSLFLAGTMSLLELIFKSE